MNQLVKLFALFIIIVTSCKGIYENGSEMADENADKVNQISVEELQQKIENGGDYYLIDIRQSSDYYTANIPGSVLVQRGILEFKIADAAFWAEQYIYPPEKNSEIIIYSDNGDLGVLAASALTQLGYTRVFNLKGGYKAFNPNLSPDASAVQPGSGCGG